MDVGHHNSFQTALGRFPSANVDSVPICRHFTQIIGYMAISYSLGNLPASVVSPSLNLQPVVTIILAIPLLNEVPSSLQLIGSLLTLGGVYIINYAYQQKNTDLV